MAISIKNAEGIEKMRIANRIVAMVHEEMRKQVKPGITTGKLDKIAEETGRTRNEVIQKCLSFAVDNLEIKEY